ncbi:MAG: hypothetical protein PHF20_01420 [Halothiobacillaceae bacterium]|nr:hypothetical protein [Halothiobacillaceae bacterium]
MEFNLLEWLGAVTGLYGAFLLARRGKNESHGWYWFLAANVFVIAFAIQQVHVGLLVQQVGFTMTSLLGIYRRSKAQPRIASFPDIAEDLKPRASLEDYYNRIPCQDTCPSSGDEDACAACDVACSLQPSSCKEY